MFKLLIDTLNRESEVKRLTSSGKNLDALKAALADPPLSNKYDDAKVCFVNMY